MFVRSKVAFVRHHASFIAGLGHGPYSELRGLDAKNKTKGLAPMLPFRMILVNVR